MTGRLSKAKRVVIKIGSSLLVDQKSGDLRRDWLDALMDDVAAAREQGQDILVVSSGAIALGRHSLGLGTRVLRLEDSQAAAAAGQIRLGFTPTIRLGISNISPASPRGRGNP